MSDNNILVTKSTGKKEPFKKEKLVESLIRAKAREEVAIEIAEHIADEIEDGMSTKEIYRHAFEILRRDMSPKTAARYSLRRAVMDLGPSGFAFEKFVAEIFVSKGYEVQTDVEMLGECIPHEVDVVAWNENKLIIVEAKFHNQIGLKSDVKVVLYIKARFDDLANTTFNYGKNRKVDESWLVTNTKFSSQAIHYAECKNMKIIGWNYPKDGSLQDLIEDAGLHPITCLTSINKTEEAALMQYGIVLCKQAKENPDIVRQTGMTEEKIKEMMDEIDKIQE